MSRIRVQPSPLTNTIYAGRTNKDGSAWQGEKHDVTSDVIGSIIQYVGAGNIISVNENGKPAYEIEVRAIKTEGKGEASDQGGAKPLNRCAAGRDGECSHAQCPQLRDNEPTTTGRHCPLDNNNED